MIRFVPVLYTSLLKVSIEAALAWSQISREVAQRLIFGILEKLPLTLLSNIEQQLATQIILTEDLASNLTFSLKKFGEE